MIEDEIESLPLKILVWTRPGDTLGESYGSFFLEFVP